MIKLIITDIDGTLVSEGSADINPEYFTVIKELTDRGIVFVVASGRHLMGVRTVFQPILDKVWVLSQNGGAISHGHDSRILKPIPREWICEFWDDISQHGEADVFSETADLAYCPHEDSELYRRLTEGYGFTTIATGSYHQIPEDTYSMVTIFHPVSGEAFCNQYMTEKWKDRLSLLPSGKNWVDCVMPGISKGNGLLQLCKDLHISPQDTIAFGDNFNDISMLQAAGRGYAVDTARPEVQEAADHVIPGYASDGVLQVLKEILADLAE